MYLFRPNFLGFFFSLCKLNQQIKQAEFLNIEKGSKIMILGRFFKKIENFEQEKKLKIEKYDFYHNDFFKYQSYSKLNADFNEENRFNFICYILSFKQKCVPKA